VLVKKKTEMDKGDKIRKMATDKWMMKLYMLKNLSMAAIAGLKVTEIDKEHAVVTVPYKYLTKNPFRSIYFAVLSMAAELSSGILAMALVSDGAKPVSMLVLNMKASFTKKARTLIKFVCNNGVEIEKAINESLSSGEGKTVEVVTKGYDEHGDEVAVFTFTWTFKPKN
jgi:acyl-coenzyme A thioesterase PaaI-like protein